MEISEDKTPIKDYSPQIGMFSFEIKDIYTKAIFHGTSNYLLSNNQQTKIAMRSYENNKPHLAFQLTETDDYVESTFYDGLSPSHFFLQQLEQPSRVKRSLTFKRTRILKLNDWKRSSKTRLEKGYVCGDTIERVGLLREFSISQFTYQTIEQYQAIEKEVQRNKRKYNQSYEGYFINDDGSLNYHEMILTIDLIIADGKLSINDKLDKDRHRQRDLYVQHSESKVYEAVKQQTNQGIKVDFKLDDDSDDDKTTYVTYEGEFSDLDG